MENREHFYNRHYMSRERLLTYVDQVQAIYRYSEQDDTILEVGKGNGFLAHLFTDILQQSVVTLDVLPDLQPDIVADITAEQFDLDRHFEVGVCFEVLEHIPYELLPRAVENLRKHIVKYLIISVPDTNFFWQVQCNRLFRKFKPLNITLTLPRFFRNRRVFGSDHQWEIGIYHSREGKITAGKLVREVFGSGQVLRHYRGREFPGHHFFIVKGSA